MSKNNKDLFWIIEEMMRNMQVEDMQENCTSGIQEETMKKYVLERFLKKHDGEYTPHYVFVDDTYNEYGGLVIESRQRTAFRCAIPSYVFEKIDDIHKYQYGNEKFGVLFTADTKLDYLDGYCSIGVERALEDISLRELIEDFIYDFLIDEHTHPRVGYKRRVFFEDSDGQFLGNSLIIAIDPPNFIDTNPHFVICFGHED